jgi:hypothetical protein
MATQISMENGWNGRMPLSNIGAAWNYTEATEETSTFDVDRIASRQVRKTTALMAIAYPHFRPLSWGPNCKKVGTW